MDAGDHDDAEGEDENGEDEDEDGAFTRGDGIIHLMLTEKVEDGYVDYDSDYADANRIVPDVDPYSGIFFSKDRREEVIEVEEEPDFVFNTELNAQVKLMTQGQWMKGCPEGGEQGFLFGLYSQLSEGLCPCPHDCGASVPRKKSDFFSVYVGILNFLQISN
jgi:hypothetical protein